MKPDAPVSWRHRIGRRVLALLGAGCLLAVAGGGWVHAVERFPPPDFTSGYRFPTEHFPGGVALWREWGDVAVLAGALALAAGLAIRRRSRREMLLLAVAGLLYFGFFRRGCVCVIGSIQNVAAALADSSVVLPISLLAFFLLPLIFALFFGRVFCSAVCPHGALQELMLIRPIRLPDWVARPLEWLPYLTLASGVWMAATGCGFMICRHDPFIGLFRLSGPRAILAMGLFFMALSTVIGRPYCRFACPYGALLRLASRWAWRPLTITPDECIRCGLCAEACPYGAIEAPVPESAVQDRATGKPLLRGLILAFPLMLAAGAGLGYAAAPALARLHPVVRMSDFERARAALIPDANLPERLSTFRQAGGSLDELHRQAGQVVRRVRWGGIWAGLFVAGVIGCSLAGTVIRRTRPDWRADPARCVACARCVRYCPRELRRLRTGGAGDGGGTS